jgi:predicted flap endonuclease-1-like 5' DNA nuclease
MIPATLQDERMGQVKIIEIEGVGERYAGKLANAGVKTVERLLVVAGPVAGRQQLAQSVGVDDARVLEWVNRADLMRVRGVGSEFSDLLEAAGVDSPVELARRNAENLHERMLEVNAARKLTRRTPALSQVQRWIDHAKTLQRAVFH